MTNRHVLEGTIRSLEAAEARGARAHAPARPAAALHRVPPRRVLGRTRENLEAIGHQLATITELVHLMHQESLAPAGPAGVSVEIDRVLADFEDGEGALRELLEIGVEGPHDLPLEAACSRRIGG